MARVVFYDRIKETTGAPGTGNVTLAGAVTQFQSFSSRYAIGVTFYYVIADQSGVNWETGYGHLSASNILVRDTVQFSSNGDALVNFSTGTQDVFVAFTADRANEMTTDGQQIAQFRGYAMP